MIDLTNKQITDCARIAQQIYVGNFNDAVILFKRSNLTAQNLIDYDKAEMDEFPDNIRESLEEEYDRAFQFDSPYDIVHLIDAVLQDEINSLTQEVEDLKNIYETQN